jgi:hypothetical protein
MLERDPERRVLGLERALEARPTSWPAAYHLGLAYKARRSFARQSRRELAVTSVRVAGIRPVHPSAVEAIVARTCRVGTER